MVFVYTGKGSRSGQNEDAPPEQKACTKEACAIQWCLARRNHKEHYCKSYIDAWKDCRDRAIERHEQNMKNSTIEHKTHE